MLQPYIDMAKERVTEPLVEDPNTDKAIKGNAIVKSGVGAGFPLLRGVGFWD